MREGIPVPGIGVLLLWWLLLINLAAFVLFGVDKRRARRGAWRISENTLLLSAALGGSLGALLGMRLFHHKTLHRKFSIGVPLLLVLDAALAVLGMARDWW